MVSIILVDAFADIVNYNATLGFFQMPTSLYSQSMKIYLDATFDSAGRFVCWTLELRYSKKKQSDSD
jgi:hypothetical protein